MQSSSIPMGQAPDTESLPIDISAGIPSPATIRHTHLGAEANVRDTGTLLLVGAVLGLLGSLMSCTELGASLDRLLVTLLELGFIVGFGISGSLLRSFNPMGRSLCTVLFGLTAALSLIGTIALQAPESPPPASAAMLFLLRIMFQSFILYILWNQKGRMVTSTYYQDEIIPATSLIHFPSQTSTVAKVFVLAIVLSLVVAFFF